MPFRIIAALPVRNGENDLPEYFKSVSRFADGVIALDDGSTDRTSQILHRENLVWEVLRNPRRESYIGWNDSENRSRLLDLCEKHKADWIFFLDADEALPDSDALALRQFVETEALPNVAYGVQMHRMIDDMEHYDKSARWNYRFFRYQTGQKLPASRTLHFDPVPTSIPFDRWVRTKFRIMHRSGLTEAKRRARYEKYLLVDPERLWQSSYENLLDPPERKERFQPFDSSRGYILDQELHEKLAADFRALSQMATQKPQ
jgi:glycosyltransferase involved in cell wall biosynthesis